MLLKFEGLEMLLIAGDSSEPVYTRTLREKRTDIEMQ